MDCRAVLPPTGSAEVGSALPQPLLLSAPPAQPPPSASLPALVAPWPSRLPVRPFLFAFPVQGVRPPSWLVPPSADRPRASPRPAPARAPFGASENRR